MIKNIDKFLKDVDALYRDPSTDSVRVADNIMIKHSIAIPGLWLSSFQYSETAKIFAEKTFVLQMYGNTLLPDAPRVYSNCASVARDVFARLELTAHETNKMRPLTTEEMTAIMKTLMCMPRRTTYKRVFQGQDYTDTYTMRGKNGLVIRGVQEFNHWANETYSYVSIQNPWWTASALPRAYNSQNSDDDIFAQRVIGELKKHVR